MNIEFHIPSWLLYVAGGIGLVMVGVVLGVALLNRASRSVRLW